MTLATNRDTERTDHLAPPRAERPVQLVVVTRDSVEQHSAGTHGDMSEALFAALEMVQRWARRGGSPSLAQVAQHALDTRDAGMAATVVDLWNAQQRQPLADGSSTVWVLAPANA